MICPYCGKENHVNGKYVKCCDRFENETLVRAYQEMLFDAAREKQKKEFNEFIHKKSTKIIAAAVAVAIVALIIICCIV
jgi:transposase-like protein